MGLRVAIFALAGCLVSTLPAKSQAQAPAGAQAALAPILLDLVGKVSGDRPSTASQTLTRALAGPVPLPNYKGQDAEFSAFVAALDFVPSISGDVDVRRSRSVKSALLAVVENIQFRVQSLTIGDKAELDRAMRVVYANGTAPVPSATFTAYSQYRDKYNEQVAALVKETNPAARSAIINEMTTIERDWLLFGFRSEVDEAQETIGRLKDNSADLIKQFRLVAEMSPMADAAAPAIVDLLNSSGWIRVSISDDRSIQQALPYSVDSQRGNLPPLTRVSFDFIRYGIPRQFLADPLLTSTAWRLKAGLILSDGDRSADKAEELVPRVVTELIVAKNIELTFGSDVPDALAAGGSTGARISVGGVPFNSATRRSVAVGRRYLAANGAVILGQTIYELPRIPNPAPGSVWP